MANENPLRYDIPLAIRVDQAFLDAVEELRRAQTPIPSKAEAIRGAVMAAVAALPRKKGGKA